MENQVCPKSKTGLLVAPEIVVHWSQIKDCDDWQSSYRIIRTKSLVSEGDELNVVDCSGNETENSQLNSNDIGFSC